MRPYLTSFYEITLEPELFLKLTDKLIVACGQTLKWRRDVTGSDTLILSDAERALTLENAKKDKYDQKHVETPLFGDLYEQDDRLEYEAENFWNIYRRIADEFNRVFGAIDLNSVPFRHPKQIEEFATDIWSSFFEREVSQIIEYNERFPLLIIRTVSYPDEYLETTDEIEEILMRRYRINS